MLRRTSELVELELEIRVEQSHDTSSLFILFRCRNATLMCQLVAMWSGVGLGAGS